MSKITQKQKKKMMRLAAGSVLFLAGLLLPFTGYEKLAVFLPAYLLIGGDVLKKALRNIFAGQIFDENFLMCVATIGAFFVAEYPEAVAVMLFYQVGELFQDYAVNRSRASIAELMDIRPDYANIRQEGELVQVDPEEVAVGQIIVVKAGEKIPLDGTVRMGASSVDTSALTGESVPRTLSPGEAALSGCVNLTGVLEIEVTKEFGESTVSKILDLVENASSKKAKAENFITRFARYYTPAVVAAAALLAFIPPLFIPGAQWADWVHRALIFLVISCPCALVISIPLGFFGGIGGASKCGILVKGSNYLEALASAEVVVFDKTGTLTKGTFKVTESHPVGIEEERLLFLAAAAESYSTHPIAAALRAACSTPLQKEQVTEVEELAGFGVQANVNGTAVLAGNRKLMESRRIFCEEPHTTGTVVYIAQSGAYAGYLIISDEVKEDAAAAIAGLKEKGICKTVMLTGDRKEVGLQVAKELGLDEVYTDLLPADKVTYVEKLIAEKSPGKKLVFVGDGINDAPVLAGADIGIAMGGLGSDAAIEAADIVIMDDKPSKIVTAMCIAKKTLRVVKQNIVFALAVKVIVLLMGAFGIATMWEAVFADVGVSVLAILNAMRALRVKEFKS